MHETPDAGPAPRSFRCALLLMLALPFQALAQTEPMRAPDPGVAAEPATTEREVPSASDPAPPAPAAPQPAISTQPSDPAPSPRTAPTTSAPASVDDADAQTARAQAEARELAAQSARMEDALAELAELNGSSAASEVFGVIADAVFIGMGLYVGIDGANMGDGYGRGAVSGGLITFGAAGLAGHIRNFGLSTRDELTLAQFRAARADPSWDRVALARFEGRLIVSAEAAEAAREGRGAVGIGFAIGGAGTIALAAAQTELTDRARVLVGVLGGVYVAMGTLLAIGNLGGESAHTRVLREYQRAEPREGERAEITVAPVLAPDRAGLHVAGAF